MSDDGRVDLADFLLARIAEDEAMLAVMADDWPYDGGWRPEYVQRVKAECKAKRELIAMHVPHIIDSPKNCRPNRRVMQVLALPYADHPDYDEAWRP